ncbi:tRNA lysidine(34) synthetase TilS [Shewanella surugensis]|uniref:tRNA(Ile)-lysidine synthase n=1 Tax=Shewanella surugensis TaxID=212020 RepID=A0ABT0LG62_9GAMM|nr:tRNA lysidine(34) synthetase TilS [Shewanella surugensis]MCL1126650.1 tRNA lysidine(34) synthetase TilS [Shewanella surugensis]
MQIVELIEQSLSAANIQAGAKLVLAYSGGVDSEVLAHGLSLFAKAHLTRAHLARTDLAQAEIDSTTALKMQLHVKEPIFPAFKYQLIHVHHGLSVNADEWALHCQRQAARYQLPFTLEKVTVNRGPRLSIEAEARTARYHAISQHMQAGDVLLTAHHQDDQLETVLLALKRGLGPKGLASMGADQVFNHDKWLLRPLLAVERTQIETYAHQYGLVHIEDESNVDVSFDRNFLRAEIIPKLKARWPSIAKTASRSAKLCSDQQTVLDDEVASKLPVLLTSSSWGVGLDLIELALHNSAWQVLLLRGFIDKLGFSPLSQVQNKELLVQVLQAKMDAKQEMRVGNMLARRFQQTLYLAEAKQEQRLTQAYSQWAKSPIALNMSMPVMDEADTQCQVLYALNIDTNTDMSVGIDTQVESKVLVLYWCKGLVIDAQTQKITPTTSVLPVVMPLMRPPKVNETVALRFAASGSMRCHPHFRDKGRELKKLWQELNIAPWARSRIPLIFYNEKLVCAVGYWIEKGFVLQGEHSSPVDGAARNMTHMSQAMGLEFRVE